MSRVNAVLVLLLAFSSICFGATLMQFAVAQPSEGPENPKSSTCQNLIERHHHRYLKRVAQEIYQEAFKENLSGNWQKAREASTCAAQLINGTEQWRVDTPHLAHGLQNH